MSLSPLFHQMPPQMRRLRASFHRREYLNSANPECLPEGCAPKDRGLPSPNPVWVIAQALLQILSATTPKLVWRFFGAWIRTVRPGLAPSEPVVAVALRGTSGREAARRKPEREGRREDNREPGLTLTHHDCPLPGATQRNL
jgi:hypothetical protein